MDNNVQSFFVSPTEEVENVIAEMGDFHLCASDFLPTSRSRSGLYPVRCGARNGVYLKHGCIFKIPFGFRMIVPNGYWILVYPLIDLKHPFVGLQFINDERIGAYAYGVYMPDACSLISNEDKHISFGEIFAQLQVIKTYDLSL
ncbi:MAG TPA: hypothetical protein VI423_11140 [Paenisporosarcina sp.]|nr:hypothetical protein [Paenisporosarcina sp.]